VQDFGVLRGNGTYALCINNVGQIVGCSANRAFLYENGVLTEIETLGRAGYAIAYGINDSGQIVGGCGGDPHAFLYDGTKTIDLNTFGGDFSEAFDINNHGQVVGYIGKFGGDTVPFSYEDGVTTDLGNFGGWEGRAHAINDHGQIVGFSRTEESAVRAFLYEDGMMHNLNDLIPPNSGWVLSGAYDINSSGQIVGSGHIDGEKHAYLLTPREPVDIYVDDSAVGANDGSSWEDAFNEYYDGLDAAVLDNKIIVAQGTYLPDTAGLAEPRDATFQMKNGVTIEGGYAGFGEPDPDARDVELYETILSGDLLGNDNPDTPLEGLLEDPSRLDNCYHVVYNPTGSNLNESAILDGFTVTSGNADGSSSAERSNVGGGMLNRDSSPTVTNCTFIRNSADGQYGGSGAGMASMYCSTTVTDCKFISNIATGVGGGMYEAESKATITGCTFSGNSAGGGGGMCNADDDNDSVPTVSNCTFVGNSSGKGAGMYNTEGGMAIVSNCTFSDNDGCGMYSDEGGSAEVIDCTFSDNNGPGIHNNGGAANVTGSVFIRNLGGRYGGGISNYSCNPIITRCTFIDNSAENFGGGIGNYEASPTISYCTFIGNSAPSGGGVWNYEWDSKPEVINCIFIGNSATYGGGGMCNAKYSIPTVINCTFSANTAGYGGAIVNSYVSTATLTNCVLWGNKAVTGGSQIALIYYSSINVEHCDIQYGQDGVFIDDKPTPMNWGNGNIDLDPQFVDANGVDGIVGTQDDDLRLLPGSLCIDAGDNSAVTVTTDLDGNPRIVDGDNNGTATVDMGSDEAALSIEVLLDIKPGSCPNPVNVKSKGVLPVAILGTEEFDVSVIDPASIFLNGVPAIRSSYEDVGGPVANPDECECTANGPDGFDDLSLKFKTQDIVETFGEVNAGDILTLPLTGVLNDGTGIEGADCVVIVGRHKPINKADINEDGLVNTVDIAIVAENWLQSSIVEE